MENPDAEISLINVITPVLNSSNLLIQTMQSVVSQVGLNTEFRVRHIIVDGNSTDLTIIAAQEFIEKHSDVGVEYILISESDSGMYDALSKGFMAIKPGVVCYQNAGDLYHQGAFSVVNQLFSKLGSGWIYGRKATFTDEGTCVIDDVPIPYIKSLAHCGYYGFQQHSLGFFQQESLFFSHDLLETIDLDIFRSFRLAGDFYLFLNLIQRQHGVFINALLSGHRLHIGQLSENINGYKFEMKPLLKSRTILNYMRFIIHKFAYKLPKNLRLLLHTNCFYWDHRTREWKLRFSK